MSNSSSPDHGRPKGRFDLSQAERDSDQMIQELKRLMGGTPETAFLPNESSVNVVNVDPSLLECADAMVAFGTQFTNPFISQLDDESSTSVTDTTNVVGRDDESSDGSYVIKSRTPVVVSKKYFFQQGEMTEEEQMYWQNLRVTNSVWVDRISVSGRLIGGVFSSLFVRAKNLLYPDFSLGCKKLVRDEGLIKKWFEEHTSIMYRDAPKSSKSGQTTGW